VTAVPVKAPAVVLFDHVTKTYDNGFTAIKDVSFVVEDIPGKMEFVTILGPSGCGKSTVLRLIAGLPPQYPATSGTVLVGGQPVLSPGSDRGMMFQDYSSFDNRTVEDNVAFGLECRGIAASERRERAREWIKKVGLDVDRDAAKYPHQLSGGMRQRVLIAMALIMKPALIIADEPTTALDVTIQAQILDLLVHLQKEFGTSILMITHDLGVIAETTSRVIVMYAGEIVEEASVTELFARPHHPYTEGLMHSMPHIGHDQERLNVIPGTVPAPTNWPHGCRFRERCPYSWDLPEREHPPLYDVGAGHISRCHLAREPERRNHPHQPLVVQEGVGAA